MAIAATLATIETIVQLSTRNRIDAPNATVTSSKCLCKRHGNAASKEKECDQTHSVLWYRAMLHARNLRFPKYHWLANATSDLFF